MIGRYHDFSCGLSIGGNSLDTEKENISQMNILITSPGRLLQHLGETTDFNTDNLQVLIIDEADRILDEGFEETINEILTYLPLSRQTMLFSATLTKSIKRLANVTMKSPEYISLHEAETNTNQTQNQNTQDSNGNTLLIPTQDKKVTPLNLTEFYTICPAHEKLDILYSFLKTHLKSKCVIFVSSCKQVRFYFEAFKRLKLGLTFFELHGRQKQSKRTAIYYNFSQSSSSVLFATDVVSRGIDFPGVDWVIQLDCPEDVSSYVHKVGRTARYKAKGNSLLFISNGEKKFIDNLMNFKGMYLKKITINPVKMSSLRPILGSILSENKDIMYLAQKALISYVKSVHMNGNKEVFDIKNIDIKELALSYGLFNAPEMRIIQKGRNGNSDDSEDEVIDQTTTQTKKELKNNSNIDQQTEGTSEKKLSKLERLKQKIKEKKLKEAEKLNQDNEKENKNTVPTKASKPLNTASKPTKDENTFLKLKRKPEEVEQLLQDENIPNFKHITDRKSTNVTVDDLSHQNKNVNPIVDMQDVPIKKSAYYEKIKGKLEKNLEFDLKLQKSRIADKHKKDKLKAKELDLKKHGLDRNSSDEDNDNEDDDENSEGFMLQNENPAFAKGTKIESESEDESEQEYKVKSNKKKKDSKIKDTNNNSISIKSLNNASLEDKAKAALALIKNKNSLFKI